MELARRAIPYAPMGGSVSFREKKPLLWRAYCIYLLKRMGSYLIFWPTKGLCSLPFNSLSETTKTTPESICYKGATCKIGNVTRLLRYGGRLQVELLLLTAWAIKI